MEPTPQQIQKVKEMVMAGEGYLHIKQCPKNTVEEFLLFANNKDEWCGNWGLAFKHVWDFYKGMNPRDNEVVLQRLEALEALNEELLQRLTRLEMKQNAPAPDPRVRVMADGSLRKV
jgi:hypothetical protein